MNLAKCVLPGETFDAYGATWQLVVFTGVSRGVHQGRAPEKFFDGPAGQMTATLSGLTINDGDEVSMMMLRHPDGDNGGCFLAYNHSLGTFFDVDLVVHDMQCKGKGLWHSMVSMAGPTSKRLHRRLPGLQALLRARQIPH